MSRMKRFYNYFLVIVAFLLFVNGCRMVPEQVNVQLVPVTTSFVTHEIFMPSGSNLSSEMRRIGLTPIQIIQLTNVFGDNVDFRSLQPNDHFRVIIEPETNIIVEFSYMPNIVTTHRMVWDFETNTYNYIFEEREVTTRMVIAQGIVYTTLDQALNNANVEPTIRHAATNALSARINFSAHARAGDSFKIMYSERHFEGTRVPGSRLYYVSYNGRATGFHEGFRFTDTDPRSAFHGMYTPQGVAMTNAMFRLPLDRNHVSSPFGNRFHPITRRWQMHTGVDYRAALGTPVYAVASGRVIKARRDGGWGNVIEIQHANNYVTQYAHLQRMRVRQGDTVSRGTVIGTVGSTGQSTGPHLHFGLRVGGRWVNPNQLRMVAATQLEGQRLDTFKLQIPEIRSTLHRVENEPSSPFEMTAFERHRRVNGRA